MKEWSRQTNFRIKEKLHARPQFKLAIQCWHVKIVRTNARNRSAFPVSSLRNKKKHLDDSCMTFGSICEVSHYSNASICTRTIIGFSSIFLYVFSQFFVFSNTPTKYKPHRINDKIACSSVAAFFFSLYRPTHFNTLFASIGIEATQATVCTVDGWDYAVSHIAAQANSDHGFFIWTKCFSRMEVIEIQTDTIGLFEIENQYSHGLALWSIRHRLCVRHETMNMSYNNLWKGIEQYYRKEKRKVKISYYSKNNNNTIHYIPCPGIRAHIDTRKKSKYDEKSNKIKNQRINIGCTTKNSHQPKYECTGKVQQKKNDRIR